jgi:hypothetical protein
MKTLLIAILFFAFSANAENSVCKGGVARCYDIKNVSNQIYISCIMDTCKLANAEDYNCTGGQKWCLDNLKQYKSCIEISCGGHICDSGKTACRDRLSQYFACVAGKCLGSVDVYHNIQQRRNVKTIVPEYMQNYQEYHLKQSSQNTYRLITPANVKNKVRCPDGEAPICDGYSLANCLCY